MDLTTHFSAEEMGYDATPAQYQPNVRRLAYLLEELRAAVGGVPMDVSSVWRTPEHNEAVGGVANSAHLTGSAADFTPRGISVAEYLGRVQQARAAGKAPAFGQMEVDPQDGHIHVSLARSGQRNGEILLALPGGGYRLISPGTMLIGGGVFLLVGLAVAWWASGSRWRFA